MAHIMRAELNRIALWCDDLAGTHMTRAQLPAHLLFTSVLTVTAVQTNSLAQYYAQPAQTWFTQCKAYALTAVHAHSQFTHRPLFVQ
jgi:hypothetical protein